MNEACRTYGLPELDWRRADSVQIARRAWPEFRGNGGHGLGHLKKALALEFNHHDAGEDAKAAALVVLRAEAHTGKGLEELMPPHRKRPTKTRKSQTNPTKSDATDPMQSLDKLKELVAFLMEERPLSGAEIEKKRQDNSSRAISRMLETGENYGQAVGSPDFLTLPEDEFRVHLRAIDNNLCEQVKIVEAACQTYFKTGENPAPYYAWRIVIILSKQKHGDHERDFLTAWCRHFGGGGTVGRRYEDLVARARKRGVEV